MDTPITNSVPHPGEFIKDELEERGWSQRDLSYILGCPEQAVNMIVSGKRAISPEMAKALGAAFEVHPDFFANLQRAYDQSRAREPEPGVARRARIQSVYPLREMIKRGWIEDADPALLEDQLCSFFEVSELSMVPHMAHAAKKTGTDVVATATQFAWLHRVRQIAKASVAPPYNKKALEALLPRLRQLAVDVEEVRHVPRLLAEAGVIFILVEALPSGKIDGVCFWLGKQPVIGMSMRYDRNDNFWFVLRHEIEHVLQGHGKVRAIIDDLDVDTSQIEEECVANEAAQEFCVPSSKLDSFVARKAPFFSERDVIAFAHTVQMHPGVVIGQLQRKIERRDLLNKLKAKIKSYIVSSAIHDGFGVTARG